MLAVLDLRHLNTSWSGATHPGLQFADNPTCVCGQEGREQSNSMCADRRQLPQARHQSPRRQEESARSGSRGGSDRQDGQVQLELRGSGRQRCCAQERCGSVEELRERPWFRPVGGGARGSTG